MFHKSLRMILGIATQRKMVLHQQNIKTGFLNGSLDEEVYMSQPEGFIQKGNERLVCKLNRSLYGLKQSSMCWNYTLNQNLLSEGFAKSSADPCVYTKRINNQLTLLMVSTLTT